MTFASQIRATQKLQPILKCAFFLIATFTTVVAAQPYGIVELDALQGGFKSSATGASGDGSVVVGYALLDGGRTQTEIGGGFPAQFDGRTEKSTEARVGINAAHPISTKTKLLGRIEAAHRSEKTGVCTSGTVVGLFDFKLLGEQFKCDWLRAGIGFEAKAGPGTVGAMLNATTQGAVPSYWLNVSCQVAF
jgi:hypothetical protein